MKIRVRLALWAVTAMAITDGATGGKGGKQGKTGKGEFRTSSAADDTNRKSGEDVDGSVTEVTLVYRSGMSNAKVEIGASNNHKTSAMGSMGRKYSDRGPTGSRASILKR